MAYFQRKLDLAALLSKKSFFLMGPRSTGKSFLIRHQLNEVALILDLLKGDLYLRLSARPWELENIINEALNQKTFQYIVIDEIQKIPMLLDEVHRLIESCQYTFLLTGSSARKLKRGHANLLAGRAWMAHLHPLCYAEISNFDLDRYLFQGGLPQVYASDDPMEELSAYVHTYLYEEIQAEGLVRKLPQFSRFLNVAALSNGQLLNFSRIASDAGVPASTVREYYSIIEDTLLGFQLFPWNKSIKRKASASSKFYFFDLGVTHALTGSKYIDRNSDLYGRSFEHWIALELRSYLDYQRDRSSLCFWHTINQDEVDFIIGDQIAIEVKASQKISPRDLKNLKKLQEEKICQQYFLISHDTIEAEYDGIRCLHWKKFIDNLWDHELFK